MAEHDITITPFQKKVLAQYQSFHASPPSVASLAGLSARGQLLMGVVIAAAAVLCFRVGIAPVGYIIIGMLVGAISRDVGQFRRVTKAWPVLDRIIDWSKLSTLLSSGAATPNS